MIVHCDFNPHAMTCLEEEEFCIQLKDSEEEVIIDIRGKSSEAIKRISESVCRMLNLDS